MRCISSAVLLQSFGAYDVINSPRHQGINMKRALLTICALLSSLSAAEALGKPAYLTCDFQSKGKPQPRKFTLDEDRGTVVIFYPETTEAQTLSARFMDDMVLFETYVDRYAITRTTLVGVRQSKLDQAIDKAPCQIDAPTGRAF